MIVIAHNRPDGQEDYMKKGIALALVAVFCSFMLAACATNDTSSSASPDATASAEASESASADATASAGASVNASADATASAEASESASADASAAGSSSAAPGAAAGTSDTSGVTNNPISVFFDTWRTKFDTIISSAGANELGINPDNPELSALSDQAKDWKAHLSGDTATISTENGNVSVSATGVDSFQQATVDWKISTDEFLEGTSPDVTAFTLAAGAMIETVAGDDTSGLEQVDDIMSTLLAAIANIRDDIVKGEPVVIGDGQFGVSLNSETKTLSIVATPTAD